MASKVLVSAIAVAVVAAGIGYYIGRDDIAPAAQADETVATVNTASPSGMPESSSNPKVASIGDAIILKSDVEQLYGLLKARTPQGLPTLDQMFWMLTDQMIGGRLLVQKAEAEKFDEKPEVKLALAMAREQVLQEAFLGEALKGLETEAVLKPKYDALVAGMKAEKEIKARHILVKDEAKAKDIIAQLAKGGDFVKLAKDNSEDPGSKDNGGDLGFFSSDMMVPEFYGAAAQLKAGEVSKEPVKTQFGWHVIKVEELKDRTPPKFEEVKTQLLQQMQQEKVGQIISELRTKANVQRFTGEGLPPLPKSSIEEALERAAVQAESPKDGTVDAPKPQ
jgi:peptidyl-prolyl cis-trans isomerase C